MNENRHGLWFHLFDVVLNIVIIVAIVGGIRTFLVSPFQIEGNSMLSTLEHKQYIVINKLAYHLGNPERGDIVVFRPESDPSKPFVKRVVGVAGDDILIRGGFVYVRPDGAEEYTKLEEPYLNENNYGRTYQDPPSSGNTDEIRFRVPEGRYFLMGDNRQNSLDSRSLKDENGDPAPYIQEESILGRVWVVLLPISQMQVIEPFVYDL